MASVDNVIKYFKEISKIPRETFKEKQISDYLVKFAQERNLEVIQDDFFNVIIKRKSNIDNYNGQAVILQCHMDMVYEKGINSNHIYESGIEVIEKDGYFYGNNTTLGADNGIAVAYCLELLDSNDILIPDLEVIITTQEEGGLAGANNLAEDSIKGKYLINLDSEEEGVFFTSCAGGVRNYVRIPLIKEKMNIDSLVSVNILGLKGGHSGLEIDLERGNAIKLLGRLLYCINDEYLNIVSLESIGKANTISNKAKAVLAVPKEKESEVIDKVKKVETILKKELHFTDNLQIKIETIKNNSVIDVYSVETKNKVINILMLMPCGVINKSQAIPGLVQTSCNVGSLEEINNCITILNSIRSSVESQKYYVSDLIKIISDAFDAEWEFFNDYPQWEYKAESKLRDMVIDIYESEFKRKAKITAIHAGLECGYFDKKLSNVDIISLGPNLYDVHTANEHVSIESIKNVWILIVKLLLRIANEK